MLPLTFAAIFLSIYDIFKHNGLNPREYTGFIWADFYFTAIFVIEYILMIIYRDRTDYKTIFIYVLYNWYDLFSFICRIPGLYNYYRFTLLPFKLCRLIRLYKRIIMDQRVILLMVKKPFVFLSCVLFLFMLICAVCLKILEQEAQPEFASLYNVLYFTIISVSTTGYGDMKPRRQASRVIVIIFLLAGIGLFTTISTIIVESIVSVIIIFTKLG